MQNLSYEDEFGLRETHFHVDNKSIHMTQEQPVIIACIPVARISKNLQFFTNDPGSGTVFLPLLPICQVFLLLKTKC